MEVNCKRRNPPIIGTSEKEGTLVGIPTRSHLHIWNFKPGTTEDDLKGYVKHEIPEIDTSTDIEIEKCKVSRGDYVSFRLSVNSDFRETLINATFWPKHVRVGYYHFRKPFRPTPER
jgi:hypothetical protein